VNVADFFDQDGELTNVEGLADACRGYISYVRVVILHVSHTVISVYSTGAASRWPKLGIDRKTPNNKSEMIELVTSPASALQEAVTLDLSEGR
jgi:hypothetical protein